MTFSNWVKRRSAKDGRPRVQGVNCHSY